MSQQNDSSWEAGPTNDDERPFDPPAAEKIGAVLGFLLWSALEVAALVLVVKIACEVVK